MERGFLPALGSTKKVQTMEGASSRQLPHPASQLGDGAAPGPDVKSCMQAALPPPTTGGTGAANKATGTRVARCRAPAPGTGRHRKRHGALRIRRPWNAGGRLVRGSRKPRKKKNPQKRGKKGERRRLM